MGSGGTTGIARSGSYGPLCHQRGIQCRGVCILQRPEKGVRESYADDTRDSAVDLRGHLEVSGSEDSTETDTHGGSAINQGGDKAFSSSTARGQET